MMASEEKSIYKALCSLLDDGYTIFSPDIWQDAIIYIRFLNGMIPELDKEGIKKGESALRLYQARYIIHKFLNKLGRRKMLLVIRNKSPLGAWQYIKEVLDEEELEQKLVKQSVAIITPKELDGLSELSFKYNLRLMEFTEDAETIAVQNILNGVWSDKMTDYYLGASCDFKSYSKLYPALRHIIKTTKDSHLFWLAGDWLAIIWNTLPDDEKIQRWFGQEIFEMFWSRIENLFIFENRHRIEYKNPSEQKIFNDALNWICSLGDPGHYNKGLRRYLDGLVHNQLKPENLDAPDAVKAWVEYRRANIGTNWYEPLIDFNNLSLTEEEKKAQEAHKKDLKENLVKRAEP